MKSSCKVDWCDREIQKAGFCNAHYQRFKKGSDMDKPIHRKNDSPICSVLTCSNARIALGLCSTHWGRQKAGKDLNTPVRIIDPNRGCSVVDCKRNHFSMGYCQMHYSRARDKKDLNTPPKYVKSKYIGLYKNSDVVGHSGAHARVYRLWGAAKQYFCIACGEQASDWAYDGTDPTEMYAKGPRRSYMHYSRYPEFYMPMCRICHSRRDKNLAAQELYEYREWKNRTGMTLKDVS